MLLRSKCRFYLAFLFLVAVSSLGCGKADGPFDYMPVHGRLTYDDGTTIPASGIRLQIETQDAKPVNGLVPRVGSANLDDKGEFAEATSLKYGDGLIPGKHKVAIQYAVDKDGKLLVPEDYTHLGTSPLVIDTGDGNIEMKVPKP